MQTEQWFVCAGCKTPARVVEILEVETAPHIVCEHCAAKNKLYPLPVPQGERPQFAVIGLVP